MPPLIGRIVAADAFSHAVTDLSLPPAMCKAETFTRTGLHITEGTTPLAELVQWNTPHSGADPMSMEWPGYASSA
ncbi:hypothetical protein [Roseomonas elaeocarpi]|uniref:Uncharacterized protein n=1 Tax=Roseomonas elaeocarpi TaxID=907779 RepID=A0ABV6JN10_9PROT